VRKILLFALLIRLLFIFGRYHPDLGNHLDWGVKFWEYGPKRFYEQTIWGVSWPNQPPGTIYLWGLAAKLKEIIFGFFWWLNLNLKIFPSFIIPFFELRLHTALVKIPSVLAELGIGWLIYLIVKKLKNKKTAEKAGLIFLFNPITIYNSAIWGQTDGLVNFFGLLAIYFFFEKKPILAMFSFLLSFYIKGSLLIFFPVVIWFLIKDKYSLKTLLLSLFIPVMLIFLITLPFVSHNPVWKWIYDLYQVRVFGHQGNMLSGNAFNLWALIFGVDLSKTDNQKWLFFDFRSWGKTLFILAILPSLLNLFFSKTKNEKVFFSLAVISFAAFLFLTNMHERYLYPVFPYLAILVGFQAVPLWFYLVISCIHLLNLYNLWFYPEIPVLREFLSYQTYLPGRLMSFILIFLFLRLYSFSLRPKSGKIA